VPTSRTRQRAVDHDHLWCGEGKSNRYWLNSPKDEGVTLRERQGGSLSKALWKTTFASNGRSQCAILISTSHKRHGAGTRHLRDQPRGTPNIKELADSSTRSPRHVQRLLKELAEGGWLQITVRRRHESNVYFLTTGQSAVIERRRAPSREALRDDTTRGVSLVSPHLEMTPASSLR